MSQPRPRPASIHKLLQPSHSSTSLHPQEPIKTLHERKCSIPNFCQLNKDLSSSIRSQEKKPFGLRNFKPSSLKPALKAAQTPRGSTQNLKVKSKENRPSNLTTRNSSKMKTHNYSTNRTEPEVQKPATENCGENP